MKMLQHRPLWKSLSWWNPELVVPFASLDSELAEGVARLEVLRAAAAAVAPTVPAEPQNLAVEVRRMQGVVDNLLRERAQMRGIDAMELAGEDSRSGCTVALIDEGGQASPFGSRHRVRQCGLIRRYRARLGLQGIRVGETHPGPSRVRQDCAGAPTFRGGSCCISTNGPPPGCPSRHRRATHSPSVGFLGVEAAEDQPVHSASTLNQTMEMVCAEDGTTHLLD